MHRISAVGVAVLLSLVGCLAQEGEDPSDLNESSQDVQKQKPRVTAVSPLAGATGVALDSRVRATFSGPMDAATLTTSTFTLTSGATAAPILGTVSYVDLSAVFTPSSLLATNTLFTATVTTGAKSAAGIALASKRTWTFSTGVTATPSLAVNLGTAGNFAILSKSGISTVPASAITGDIAVSPAPATYITGFALIADSTNVFARSSQVTGKVYAADYAAPTPSNLTTAVSDMQLAYTDAAGRAPDVTELGAGNIGGMTLAPGVYKWSSGLLIPTNLTLTGNASSIWIFQIGQGLTMSSGKRITLAGGALAKNVFWQVAGAVEIGTTAHLEGIVLTQTAVALRTGASLKGRLLAQTAVTLDRSTVIQP
jgi:hypothetical protein